MQAGASFGRHVSRERIRDANDVLILNSLTIESPKKFLVVDWFLQSPVSVEENYFSMSHPCVLKNPGSFLFSRF